MRRISHVLGTCALIAALIPAALPASADGGHPPKQIDLPAGWQPEGITTDGRFLFVGSLVNGAIFKADPRTGNGRVLSAGKAGWVAVGLDYDRRRDLIWAAGGGTNDVRAYDAETGQVVAEYDFPSTTPRFLNDLVVTRSAVYVTDSFHRELGVVPLRHDDDRGVASGQRDDHRDELPPASAATILPLTGDLVLKAGFNLNGIVVDDGRLTAVQSNTGKLFRINPRSGKTFVIPLGGRLVKNGDGLELARGLLFVVRNQDNKVAVVHLRHEGKRGEVVAVLTDKSLDIPSTAAFVSGSLWVVNARFTTPPTPQTPYWITRIGLHDLDDD